MNSARFFSHESCGQCTPCREGTSWATRLLTRITHGKGRLKDLDLLAEIGDTIGIMPGTTICGLADGAAWPLKNGIKSSVPKPKNTSSVPTQPVGWKPIPFLL
ncbi:MAG: NADH-ubiquinone oxidoreductase-F iron-sulfur binding region domain-containing protein [Pirellulales bacterium]